ncbi:hypothetical protein QSJ18_11745 [Gordonia sp. ABSL1-1]|uniref:hypothetical protein n=1 Tax=Gordonia sp. ABSL1-1 TaxID=3053923 RepID=UPI0025741E41|nr:hypothetical protein [Gordonia sp. ABSL1-1]MDL9937419.1 hypothetical protein [Gordonia sp. ABSL1-1]
MRRTRMSTGLIALAAVACTALSGCSDDSSDSGGPSMAGIPGMPSMPGMSNIPGLPGGNSGISGDKADVSGGFIDPCKLPAEAIRALSITTLMPVPMSGRDAASERGCMGIRIGVGDSRTPQGASIWFLSWAPDVSFMERRWSEEAKVDNTLPANWRRISYTPVSEGNRGCMLLYRSATQGWFGIADAFADADDCTQPRNALSIIARTLPD